VSRRSRASSVAGSTKSTRAKLVAGKTLALAADGLQGRGKAGQGIGQGDVRFKALILRLIYANLTGVDDP